MKTPFFLLYFFFAFVLVSCKKKDPLYDGIACTGDCFIISGRVKDSASNIGLADAEVRIYFRYANYGSIFPSTTDFVGRAISEASGDYRFTFNSRKYLNSSGYYYIEVYKGDYFRDPYYKNRFPAFYLESSNVNLPYTMELTMFRPAKLKVKLIAATVTDFQFMTLDYGYGAMRTGVVINGNGRKIDTLMEFKTAGDIGTVVSCSATGNGVNISRSDSVVVPAGGEKIAEFRF